MSDTSWRTAHPRFVRAVWLLLLAFALHEASEWNIVAYYQSRFPDGPALSATNVRVTLVMVVVIGWLWTLAALRAASARRAAAVILPLAGALFLNAIQHFYITLYYRDYVPGDASAGMLLVPASVLLANCAWRERLLPRAAIVAGAMLVVLTFGAWAVHVEVNVTQKMLVADRMGAALLRLVVR